MAHQQCALIGLYDVMCYLEARHDARGVPRHDVIEQRLFPKTETQTISHVFDNVFDIQKKSETEAQFNPFAFEKNGTKTARCCQTGMN